MKRYMVVLVIALALIVLLFALLTVFNLVVISTAERSEIYDCMADTYIDKKYQAIVVLGAGLKADGSPSSMLEDRLKGAVSLYEQGVSDVVILSGDRASDEYDEVSAMEKYCLEAGIPQSAIIRDDIGFSTYETMYNTVKSGGYDNIIVVTQRYHLYRAMYIGKELGAEVDGYATDYRPYRAQIKREIREYFARAKDVLAVSLKK